MSIVHILPFEIRQWDVADVFQTMNRAVVAVILCHVTHVGLSEAAHILVSFSVQKSWVLWTITRVHKIQYILWLSVFRTFYWNRFSLCIKWTYSISGFSIGCLLEGLKQSELVGQYKKNQVFTFRILGKRVHGTKIDLQESENIFSWNKLCDLTEDFFFFFRKSPKNRPPYFILEFFLTHWVLKMESVLLYHRRKNCCSYPCLYLEVKIARDSFNKNSWFFLMLYDITQRTRRVIGLIFIYKFVRQFVYYHVTHRDLFHACRKLRLFIFIMIDERKFLQQILFCFRQ